MSSDDCTSPIIQASGSHTPHTYAPAPLEAKQSAPRPSGAALPARGSTSQHLANKIRPAALSSQTLSFAHAHEQRRTRNGNADARGHASRSEGVHMADRAIVSRRESQESEEETGLLLSSPDFMLGLNGSSHYECPAGTGRVPMPISISSQSEPSDDDVPNTASTLRTARPKRYISAHTGRYALKTTRTTRPPATASPSYRLDWRHRSAHPPVSRSYSCPSLRTCKEQTGRPQARHGGGPVRHPPSNLPTPGMSAMVRNPVDETLIAGPSSTLRRALSAGSRSKRNTFGPCEIYDDAGGEYAVAAYTGAGIDGTKLKPCEAPRRHPGHPARSISDIHSCKRHLDGTESSSSSHRDSRYCPSGPSSARTSPFHGPIQLPDEVAIFPGGVRMTPTSSLDGVVGVIRASSMAISEHGMEEPKDGEEVLKDSSDAPGYAIGACFVLARRSAVHRSDRRRTLTQQIPSQCTMAHHLGKTCQMMLKQVPIETDAFQTPKDPLTREKRTSRMCMHTATSRPSFLVILCHPYLPLLQAQQTLSVHPSSQCCPRMRLPPTPLGPWTTVHCIQHPSTRLGHLPLRPPRPSLLRLRFPSLLHIGKRRLRLQPRGFL